MHPPSEAQLSRFIYYARLVKFLNIQHAPTIETEILDDLLSLSWPPSISTRQRLIFFPNIRTLSWSWHRISEDYLSFLLSPGLKELHLWSEYDSQLPMGCTLDALRYHLPLLTNFTCHGVSQYLPTIQTWLGLDNFQYVTRVRLNGRKDIPQTIWDMLSRFPHLEELELCIPTIQADVGGKQAPKTPLPINHFPSLDSLTLHSFGGQSRSFENFATESMPLERRPYALRHLGLFCSVPFEGIDATLLIQQMSNLCDRKILESFSLRVYELEIYDQAPPDIYALAPPDIVPTSLAPLLAMHSLRKPVLSPMKATDLDNDAVEEMANAWPNLEELDLSSREERWVDVPRTTLEGLIPLARMCPRLGKIDIALGPELVVSEELQSQVNQMTFCNSVTGINTTRGPICDRETGERVARFLQRLFPKLRGMDWPGSFSDEEEFRDPISEDEMDTNSSDGFSGDEGSADPDGGLDVDFVPGNEGGAGVVAADVGVAMDLSRPSVMKVIWVHVNDILYENRNK